MALRLCTTCTRHVRVGETTCPFCATALSPIENVAPPHVRGRPSSRSAVVFFGAAATVVACGGNAVAIYGTSPVPDDASAPNGPDGGDGGKDAADANDDVEQPAPMYGPAVIDAGED